MNDPERPLSDPQSAAESPPDSPPGGGEEKALSADRFSGALAELFGQDATAAPPDREAVIEPCPGEDTPETAGNDQDDGPVSPASVLEAMLFVGDPENQALTAAELAAAMRGVEPPEIGPLVDDLNARYEEDGCPYHIVSDGPGFRIALRNAYRRVRDRFYGKVRQARLSQAAIEVLSIVAYNQPLTSEQVAKVRGRPSGSLLTQLVRRGLLRLERPPEKPRTPHYSTTERFLKLFHLTTLADLPRSQDLERQ